AKASDAKCFGELDEVGTGEGGARVAALVEEFLPLPDHAEVAVVDDADFDGNAFLHRGGELAHRHLESPVADHGPDLGVRRGALAADRRRHSKPHTSP